jgi:SprT protein
MPKKEVPISTLQTYLPPGTYEAVMIYLQQYKVHLTVTRERKSILGDYRHRTHQSNHRITINSTLNPYAFLVTLLHELAHLLTFEKYGNKVQAHGQEWKLLFAELLKQFLANRIFPADIERELKISLSNPAASSCAEEGLVRVLKRYDERDPETFFVEELLIGTIFQTSDGRIFKKGEKLRKRYQCVELRSKKLYLFSGVYEVKKSGNF